MDRTSFIRSGTVTRALALAACLGCAYGAADAGVVVLGRDTIYTKIATSPTSIVPGAKDLAGLPAVTNFRALEDIVMSPDGSLWVLKARTQQGGDLETILMMGSGTSGSAFVQEGQPIIGGAPGELYDFFGSSLGAGRFNTLNHFAFSARARGGAAAVAQKVIRWTGGSSFAIPFAQGSSITGLSDLSPNPSGDEIFGNSVGSIHLLDNGTIGSQDSTILNIHTSRRPAIMYNQAAFHQSNVTNVTNFAGTGLEPWRSISANAFYTTPDGASYIALGTTGASSLESLVVNDRVVLQAGQLIPGTGVTYTATFNNDIKANGDWYARGDDPADNDWAVANGVLIAKTGDAIGPGGGESWGNTFFAFNINRFGSYVLVGNTDSTNPAADNVVVVNGVVVLREGDPIDVDNNGLFDDDAFVGRGNNTLGAFEPNDWVLTDDMKVYGFITLRNGAGQDLNSTPAFGTPQAFIRINLAVPAPCTGDLDNNGLRNTADLTILIGFFGQTVAPFTNGDLDGDGDVDTADLVAFLGVFAVPCP